jgi:putative RNA 2'-phosphotransferase
LKKTDRQNESISKFLSLVLRHKPEQIGLMLDDAGWADIGQLVDKATAAGVDLNRPIIESVAASCPKQRFTISEDRQRIRATQGHSLNVDLGIENRQPPDSLFHGTATRFLESIKQSGILPRERQYVHLSADPETALVVGRRHGKPVVLQIDSRAMSLNGYLFFLSENGVWLTEHVPYHYMIEAKR